MQGGKKCKRSIGMAAEDASAPVERLSTIHRTSLPNKYTLSVGNVPRDVELRGNQVVASSGLSCTSCCRSGFALNRYFLHVSHLNTEDPLVNITAGAITIDGQVFPEQWCYHRTIEFAGDAAMFPEDTEANHAGIPAPIWRFAWDERHPDGSLHGHLALREPLSADDPLRPAWTVDPLPGGNCVRFRVDDVFDTRPWKACEETDPKTGASRPVRFVALPKVFRDWFPHKTYDQFVSNCKRTDKVILQRVLAIWVAAFAAQDGADLDLADTLLEDLHEGRTINELLLHTLASKYQMDDLVDSASLAVENTHSSLVRILLRYDGKEIAPDLQRAIADDDDDDSRDEAWSFENLCKRIPSADITSPSHILLHKRAIANTCDRYFSVPRAASLKTGASLLAVLVGIPLGTLGEVPATIPYDVGGQKFEMVIDEVAYDPHVVPAADLCATIEFDLIPTESEGKMERKMVTVWGNVVAGLTSSADCASYLAQQCFGETKKRVRCRILLRDGKMFCWHHRDQLPAFGRCLAGSTSETFPVWWRDQIRDAI